MNSFQMRHNPLFTRNAYVSHQKWGIPIIKKQELKTEHIQLLACSETKINETNRNKNFGVHFFVDDYRFENIYNHPNRSLKRLSQYAFLLSPDFSLYADMPLWKQLENVAKNRWVGAFWQQQGLTVIPTISWSNSQSFSFCFHGVEKHATVAIGMVGCKKSQLAFMRGYNEMLKQLEPKTIIVYGTPFPQMQGNIVQIDYHNFRKKVK